jgi:pyruvate/2-oxoacid:ferredoxin oxidoreductase alpha subunit/pyruvate/2-oxoacid:ferredoxin oxidoreductase beta subunit
MIELATTGNIALVHGFLTYGLSVSPSNSKALFGAGYPITPVNEITEWGMKELPQYGGEFIQAESELAAINMVLGAASVGIPAFSVTSSPGISLMQEAISYAIGMELPLVVADVVRGGPGLGNIQGAQSDLNLAISGGHGDISPLVLAPASCQEMYDFGRLAFDYAFRYRTPAFILADGYLGQMKEKYRVPFEYRKIEQPAFSRELKTSIYVREGVLNAHNWKLNRQYELLAKDRGLIDMAVDLSDKDETEAPPADILILSYGIFSRIGSGVVERARRRGVSVAQASLKVLSPFPEEALKKLARRHRALYVLEGSCGQLHDLVRRAVGQSTLVGLSATPGGGLPTESEVVENLTAFAANLTADYLKWKTDAQEREDRIAAIQNSIVLSRGGAYERINAYESTYEYEIRGNMKKRSPRKNEVMTDVPYSYCAGCGETPAVNSIGKILERLKEFDTVLYSPVGCSIFMYDYFKPEYIRNVQVPHGRGPAAASGSKRARPELLQVVVQGDGAALDIGLNELIHCIERGENITTVIFNNGNYGMTGGQVSSTTPAGERTATTPQGRDPSRHGLPLDLAGLIQHPGVGYFRRALVGSPDDIRQFESFLANALYHQAAGHGMSIIEVFTACPSRQKPSADFLKRLEAEGAKARGKVMESVQYAARVLPQGEAPMDVCRGENVEDPLGKLEALLRARREESARRQEAPEQRFSRCLELMRSRYQAPRYESVGIAARTALKCFLGGIGGQGVQLFAEILVKALGGKFACYTNSPWYEPEVTKALTTVGLTFSQRGMPIRLSNPGKPICCWR